MIPPTIDYSDLWSKIEVAGVMSPGVCRLSGYDRKHGWDVKNASGQDGGTTTRKGDPVGAITAQFELIKSPDGSIDDYKDWDAFQKLLESTVSGSKPIALDIWHPDLARLGYKSVVLESISPVAPGEDGKGVVTVKFIEYKPPKPKKPATTSGSDPGKDEFDKQLKEREQARKEAEAERANTPVGSGLPDWLK